MEVVVNILIIISQTMNVIIGGDCDEMFCAAAWRYRNKSKFWSASRYIIDNIDRDPLYMNRVVNITAYLGEELKTKYDLDFTPERILIEFMLAETDKAFHVYGKLTKKGESKLLWLPN